MYLIVLLERLVDLGKHLIFYCKEMELELYLKSSPLFVVMVGVVRSLSSWSLVVYLLEDIMESLRVLSIHM